MGRIGVGEGADDRHPPADHGRQVVLGEHAGLERLVQRQADLGVVDLILEHVEGGLAGDVAQCGAGECRTGLHGDDDAAGHAVNGHVDLAESALLNGAGDGGGEGVGGLAVAGAPGLGGPLLVGPEVGHEAGQIEGVVLDIGDGRVVSAFRIGHRIRAARVEHGLGVLGGHEGRAEEAHGTAF